MLTLTGSETKLEERGWIREPAAPGENALWTHETWAPDEERVNTAEAIAISWWSTRVL